eukprot:COSAG02_NODE_53218_length_303_cov_0.759804_1_plen_69_part_01
MGAPLVAAHAPRAAFRVTLNPQSWYMCVLWCVHRCVAVRWQGRTARAMELGVAAPSQLVWQCVRACVRA